jgi:hypothetical protein
MVIMSDQHLDCPECGHEQLFEQPHPADCPDAPDGICPEWACTVCGTALITATVPIISDGPPVPAIAAEQERAA